MPRNATFLGATFPAFCTEFNPTKLSFSVLKVWFQCNYVWVFLDYRSFGDYLVWAVGCDHFAREQFRRAAGGLYLKESSNAFGDGSGFGTEKLRRWERGTWWSLNALSSLTKRLANQFEMPAAISHRYITLLLSSISLRSETVRS